MRKLSVIIKSFVLYCIYSVDTVDAFEELKRDYKL